MDTITADPDAPAVPWADARTDPWAELSSPRPAGTFDEPMPVDLLDLARAALDALAADDLASCPGADLGRRIEALHGLVGAAEALLVRTVAVWDGRQCWRDDGAGGARSWLTHRTGCRAADAGRRVRDGALLRHHPRIDEVLGAGELSVGHVEALARVAVPDRRAVFERDLEVLLEAARALDVDAFTRLALRWAALADDELDRCPPSERRHHDRRRLHLRELANGMVVLDGLLPAAAAAMVRGALDHLDRPDPADAPGGVRTAAQRAADNLVELASRALARPDGSADPDAAVLVVVDADVLDGSGDPAVAAVRPHGRCGLVDGTPLPPEAVRRFGCSSWVAAVLFSAEREVLHLGRRQRLFSAAQRRAITVRDGGCAFPGCDRPAAWCKTHHLDPWGPPSGGPTDIDNGCLLCAHHHRLVHEGRWRLRRDPDGGWTAFDPDGRAHDSVSADRRRRLPPPGPVPGRRTTVRWSGTHRRGRDGPDRS